MNDEETEAFLEHYGVKGMQWGVRRQSRLERLNRVASGTASKTDRVKTGSYDVALGARTSRQIKSQIQAAEQFKASVTSGKNVVRSGMKYYATRTVPGIAAQTFNRPKK